MDSITPRIVLASSSPRRKILLEQLGLQFDVISSHVEENVGNSLTPEQIAEKLALLKAQAVAVSLHNSVVIGADTIVMDDQGILGKPKDEADAYQMLARLSGKVHRVITGVALISTQFPPIPPTILVRHETTEVKITPLSDQDINSYIRTGEPLDKAGAYAIQGRGTMFVEWIRGCYNNVVGLPLFLLVTMLKEIKKKE
jgi:septum formation protein